MVPNNCIAIVTQKGTHLVICLL